MNGQLEIYPTTTLLIHAAAGQISLQLVSSAKSTGGATIALSGGDTPRGVYALLGSEPLRSRIPWEKVHLFWGDERCVPPSDPESNFRMVNEALLQRVTIPPQNVHRVKTENDPAAAAQAYEEELRQTFGLKAGTMPVFDVVMLGLGDDGHTASLFPGTPALDDRRKLVTDVYVERLQAHRVTLTFQVLNSAHHVFVLVSGTGKARILAEVLRGNPASYPAQRIQPVAGELRWLVDCDAASQLEPVIHQ